MFQYQILMFYAKCVVRVLNDFVVLRSASSAKILRTNKRLINE